MANSIIWINDLYEFYVKNFTKSVKFSSAQSGKEIKVCAPGVMHFGENESNDREDLLRISIKSSHIGTNLNGSTISREAMEAALPSFLDRPIMGYIHYVNDEPQFYGHNMHEADGKIVYDEKPVGHIPMDANVRLEEDPDNGKVYCMVDGLIYENYSEAADIIRREQECPVSVELSIRELEYNAEEHKLDLTDFYFSALTILGMDDNGNPVLPGMEGAHLSLSDFTDTEISTYSKGGEGDMANKIVNEIVDENVNDKIDNSLISTNAKDDDEDDEDTEDEENPADADDEEDDDEDEESSESDESDDENAEGGEEDEDDEDDDEEKRRKSNNSLSVSYSVTINGETRTFEKSLNEKICELSCLVDKVYGRAEDTWYDTIVYDEYIIMQDYRNNKIYRQGYSEGEDGYQLDGERVEVTVAYVTEEEEAAIKAMKVDYSSLVEYRDNAEAVKLHEQREAIVTDAKYAAMYETQGYKDLVANMDKYSLNALETAVKCLFADFAVNGGVELPQKETKKVMFGQSKKPKVGKYASLFKDKE